MSMRAQAGIVLPGYNALKVANAPTIGAATQATSTSVSVAFTAPSCVGGGAISSYTAFACCGVKTISGASSPLTVTGLTTGQTYTFKVIATNVFGPSYPSASSNSITPAAVGQQAYTTAGAYSWVAPAGVTSVSVVAVGRGGAASYEYGGGLGYKNNITVVPGNSYSVVVGSAGAGTAGTSYFISSATVAGIAGSSTGTYVGDGGGNGGGSRSGSGGGGGAGGYTGNGGNGGNGGVGGNNGNPGIAGTGGGGGGGGGQGDACGAGCRNPGSGGGVGILGLGANGTAGAGGVGTGSGTGGGGGSSGAAGSGLGNSAPSKTGGAYGGAGQAQGGSGAVRIIWPGTTRSFPSTNTGDL